MPNGCFSLCGLDKEIKALSKECIQNWIGLKIIMLENGNKFHIIREKIEYGKLKDFRVIALSQ